MTALDFPTGPSNGDIYNEYIYNSAKGAWLRIKNPVPAEKFFIGENAPTGPTAGQFWLDSSDGIAYAYYDDGSSAQWVQFGVGREGPTGPTGPTGPGATDVGLVLLHGQTYTSVSQINIDNIFSSTYEDYLVNVRATTVSGSPEEFSFFYRTNTVSNRNASYAQNFLLKNSTGSSSPLASQASSLTAMRFAYGSDLTSSSIRITAPASNSLKTSAQWDSSWTGGSPVINLETGVGIFNDTTAFDGLGIIWGTGTFNAQISVYGYKK